jgi:hypothetical protein
MNRLRLVAVGALALVAFAAAPALATTWGGEVFGTFDTHSMSDWKSVISTANAGGSNFDDPTSSWGGGLGLRIWPNSTWMIAGTWEPIFLTRKDNNNASDKLNLDAQSFQVTGGYFFPSAGNAKFGVGAGLGYYSLGGKVESATAPNIDLSGSTVGFHFLGMGEWTMSPGFAITGSAGYRVAKISDTKANDQSANPEFATDYSGFMLRAGVAFYMPSSGK